MNCLLCIHNVFRVAKEREHKQDNYGAGKLMLTLTHKLFHVVNFSQFFFLENRKN